MFEQQQPYSFPMSVNGGLFRECFLNVFNEETAVLPNESDFKIQLNSIMQDLMTYGSSFSGALTSYTAYCVMQGIIEKALSKAQFNGLTDCVSARIVDAVMPAAFRMDQSLALDSIKIEESLCAQRYRMGSLNRFLSSGNMLQVVYCHDAPQVICTGDQKAWSNYQEVLQRNHSYIEEYVFSKISCSNMKAAMPCASYKINSMNILCGSECNISNPLLVSYQNYIVFGERANQKVAEIDEMFEKQEIVRR